MNQNFKPTTLLPCAGLIYIENKKLLLAKSSKKQCYYLPGGKVNNTETALQALCREILEELNVVIAENELEFYTHISAPAYGEKDDIVMEQDCYILKRTITPKASAEIEEVNFFSLEEYQAERFQAPGAIMILLQLKKDNLIF